MTAPLKLCGDELRGGDLPRTCKLTWAHKGLHSDQDRNWVGGIEVEQVPALEGFEIIKEGGRNEALDCLIPLADGEELHLPAIAYKPGWDFYWTELRNAVDLRIDVVVTQDLHPVRWHLRKQLLKLWINETFVKKDILMVFIQGAIMEVEKSLMDAAATVDGEPLFQKLTSRPKVDYGVVTTTTEEPS